MSNSARLRVRQSVDRQVRQRGQIPSRHTRGADQADGFREQAPRYERKYLSGGTIGPLFVVDQAMGRSSATSDSKLKTASPIKKRSGGGPSTIPNAVCSASHWRLGSRFR
jgi:hypothetical protein